VGDELFAAEEIYPWRAEWQDMPAYEIQDLAPKFQIIINFACAADVEDFSRIIGQAIKAKVGKRLMSVWFPEQDIGRYTNKRYVEET